MQPTDVERITLLIERFLYDPLSIGDATPVICEALDSGLPELVELAGQAIIAVPDRVYLKPLWVLVESRQADEQLRAAAFSGIAGILLNALEDIDDPLEWIEGDDEPLMTANELDNQITQLLRIYRDAKYPPVVRRRALEVAANVSDDETVRAAGLAALGADKPEWIATGLLVLSLTDGTKARKHIEWALRHEIKDVRIEGIRRMADLGEPGDIRRLDEIVTRNSDPDETEAAIWALTEVPMSEAGEILATAKDDLKGDLRDEAAEAYALWNDTWAGITDEDLDGLMLDALNEYVDVDDDDDDDEQ